MKNGMLKRGGFTLIELLVVVLIIGILAAIALPQYKLAVTKARYMKMAPLLASIKNAEEVYFLANGEYTLDVNALDVSLPGEAKPVSGENKEGQYKLGDIEIQMFYTKDGDKCPGRVGGFHVGAKGLEMHYYYDHAGCNDVVEDVGEGESSDDKVKIETGGKRYCIGYAGKDSIAPKVCKAVGTKLKNDKLQGGDGFGAGVMYEF